MIKSYAHLEQATYSDGKMIKHNDVEMNYDGEKMVVDVNENGNEKHAVITNDKIIKIFTQPTHSKNLMSRLKIDFKPIKKSRKRKNKKSTKQHRKTLKK